MSYREVMSLPIRAFWLMNYNVGRLLAEKDMRAITVQQARHGGEHGEEVRKTLILEMGDAWKVAGQETDSPLEAERDQEGFEELKALAAMM